MALTLFQDTYLVDASVFLSGNTDWEASSLSEKEQALVNATRLLDNREWVGFAVAANQLLAWPRVSLSFFEPSLNLNVSVAQGTVPVRLQKATAFLALHLVRYPSADRTFDQTYESIAVGPITLSNSGNSGSSAVKVPAIPLSVLQLIAPLTLGGNLTGWWRAN